MKSTASKKGESFREVMLEMIHSGIRRGDQCRFHEGSPAMLPTHVAAEQSTSLRACDGGDGGGARASGGSGLQPSWDSCGVRCCCGVDVCAHEARTWGPGDLRWAVAPWASCHCSGTPCSSQVISNRIPMRCKGSIWVKGRNDKLILSYIKFMQRNERMKMIHTLCN